MKETAEYYKRNPKARKRRLKYQKEFNARPENVKKRVELNKINRRRGTYGNNDKKDASHLPGRVIMEPQSKNRGRREKSRLKGSKRS